MNRIVLVGRLTRDPETRTAPSGVDVTKFAIAVDRDRKVNGEKVTDFFNAACFGQTAKFVGDYIKKGYLVCIDGQCRIDKYTNRDGVERTAVEVNCDKVQNLQPRDQNQGGGGGNDGGQRNQGGGGGQGSGQRPQNGGNNGGQPAPANQNFDDDGGEDPFFSE